MFEAGNRWPWLLMIGALALGLYLGHRFGPEGPPAEPVYLPGETVEKEVVPQAVLNRLAAKDQAIKSLRLTLNERTGELRDAQGRLVEVTERLEAVSTASEATDEAVSMIGEAYKDDRLRDLLYRGRMVAFRFRGTAADGTLKSGFSGSLVCEVFDGDDWAILSDEPFRLHNPDETLRPDEPRTTLIGTAERPEPHRHRWYATLHVALLRETRTPELATFIFDDIPNSITAAFTPDRLRLEVGRRWFPLKRYPVRTGVWADASSAGVGLGVDW